MRILERFRRQTTNKKPIRAVEPPDGGWGWIVCAAAFLTQFVVLGTMNNFGILYVTLFKYFNDDASATCKFRLIFYCKT